MTTPTSEKPQQDRVTVAHRYFSDIDQQATCLRGYQQHYQQLSCGRFKGKCSTVTLGTALGLYQESLNQILDQSGAVPHDRYMVICLMNRMGSCKINGFDFRGDHIYFAGPGTSIAGISGPGVDSLVIDLARCHLEAIVTVCYPDLRSGLKLPEYGFLENNRKKAEGIRCLVAEILTLLQAKPLTPTDQNLMHKLRQALMETVADQLFHAFSPHREYRGTDFSRRFQIAQDVSELIKTRARESLSISFLCRQLRVSRRTIEYSMHECFGQSPIAYLRRIKLNGIRRELLNPERKEEAIGDIAADWGFWHLSRFAQQYRHHFHELPSETRRKCGLINP